MVLARNNASFRGGWFDALVWQRQHGRRLGMNQWRSVQAGRGADNAWRQQQKPGWVAAQNAGRAGAGGERQVGENQWRF